MIRKESFLKKRVTNYNDLLNISGLTDEEITKAFKMAKEELEKKKKEEEAAKETKETTSSAPAKDEGPQSNDIYFFNR